MVQISVQLISNRFPERWGTFYDSLRAFLYASKPMILEEYKISSPNVLHIAQRTSLKKKKEN